MPFLTLNGTTYAVRSNGASEKNIEHGLDRERMFDGSLRQTKRGDYREWDLTSKHLTNADALTLCTLLKSTTLPLAMGGELCGDDCAVMPQLVSNNPVHTADGFRRQVVFTLRETNSALPADTTANVFLFCQRGQGYFADVAMTTPALTEDRVSAWRDQSGNDRHLTVVRPGYGETPSLRPLRDAATQLRFTVGSDGSGLLIPNSIEYDALDDAEIMVSLKRATPNPPVSDVSGALWSLGRESGGTSYYVKSNGKICEAFGIETAVEITPPVDVSDAFYVYNVASAVGLFEVRLSNEIIASSPTSASVIYRNMVEAVIGSAGYGAYFNGWMKDIAIFDGVLTTAQRRSWYDYMSGATDDPPLPI